MRGGVIGERSSPKKLKHFFANCPLHYSIKLIRTIKPNMSCCNNQRTQTDKSCNNGVDDFSKVKHSPVGIRVFKFIQSKNKEAKQCKCYKSKFWFITVEINCLRCGCDYYDWYESIKNEDLKELIERMNELLEQEQKNNQKTKTQELNTLITEQDFNALTTEFDELMDDNPYTLY